MPGQGRCIKKGRKSPHFKSYLSLSMHEYLPYRATNVHVRTWTAHTYTSDAYTAWSSTVYTAWVVQERVFFELLRKKTISYIKWSYLQGWLLWPSAWRASPCRSQSRRAETYINCGWENCSSCHAASEIVGGMNETPTPQVGTLHGIGSRFKRTSKFCNRPIALKLSIYSNADKKY